jgi:hypothetical protein
MIYGILTQLSTIFQLYRGRSVLLVSDCGEIDINIEHYSGADPGFQVRGGALKKIAPIGGMLLVFCFATCKYFVRRGRSVVVVIVW